VLLLTVGLAIGGWQQGHLLNEPAVGFTDITKAMTFWFTFHSAGLALLLAGHLAFLINFARMTSPLASAGTKPAQIQNPRSLEPVKA
jgi:hypothetical protein